MSHSKFPWDELWGYSVYVTHLQNMAGVFQASFEMKAFITFKINDRSTVAFKHKRHSAVVCRCDLENAHWKTHAICGPSLDLLLFYRIEESSEHLLMPRLLDRYQHFSKAL